MLDTEKVDLVNNACAQLHNAHQTAWKAFCGLNDDAFHKQLEVLMLTEDLRSLRLVRDLLQKDPAPTGVVLGELNALRSGVYGDITAIIHQLNTTAANKLGSSDVTTLSHLKHNVERALVSASQHLRTMFDAFGIKPLEQTEYL